MGGLTLVTILGTRPEIIKISPVLRECERSDISNVVVHTGQHYSENLDAVFFDQLELPPPDYNLGVGSGSHGEQTAEMIAETENVLLEERPDVVLVQGDTNSVLAGAVAASKTDAKLGHVESGLRSFDRDMPEEVNRVLTDHASDYLFAPTEQSAQLLRTEGIPDDRIFVTGNTIVDAVETNRELAARKSTAIADNGLDPGEFCLMTVHRARNVDDPERFADILEGIGRFAEDAGLDVIYPIHPRAEEQLREGNIEVPNAVRVIEPQDFLDFIRLEDEAKLVITDSGGVQEEACILYTPCITVRDSTERPETIEIGANQLVGSDPDRIADGAHRMITRRTDWENPFGDGTAAEQIVEIVRTREAGARYP